MRKLDTPLLQIGDTGSDVMILQEKLKILDLFPGTVSESFGNTTADAVKQFQAANNLAVTGVVDQNTWTLINDQTLVTYKAPLTRAKPTLRLGSTGTYVAELQTELKQLGYYNYAINSTFDQNTASAVKAFQTINKLTADGIVGVNTWNALYYLYAPLADCDDNGGEATPPSDSTLYTVKAGDTLWLIAQRYGTTVDAIRSLNHLTSDVLSIGQQLQIPSSAGSTPSPDYTTYTVKSGDSLWLIAQRYGTTVAAIKALNNLTSDALTIGQQLKIPSITGSTPAPNYTTYTVKSGDSLWLIAQRYGTTVAAIKSLNHLTSDALTIGQQLRIPA